MTLSFPYFFSEHRCNSHLQLCLVGASWPLGLLAMEKQQGHELGFLHLYGDCLRLWILPRDLHPSSGETCSEKSLRLASFESLLLFFVS